MHSFALHHNKLSFQERRSSAFNKFTDWLEKIMTGSEDKQAELSNRTSLNFLPAIVFYGYDL